MIVGGFISMKLFKLLDYEFVNLETLVEHSFLFLSYTAMLISGSTALRLVPISIYCVFKNSSAVFSLFGDSLLFGTSIEYNAILPGFLMVSICLFV